MNECPYCKPYSSKFLMITNEHSKTAPGLVDWLKSPVDKEGEG